MANPTVTDYLKYTNLQMAAEAFIRNEVTGELAVGTDAIVAALTLKGDLKPLLDANGDFQIDTLGNVIVTAKCCHIPCAKNDSDWRAAA
jgi:hypothetical protein